MACHAHPCGEAAERGGVGVIDVEGKKEPPPPRPLGAEAESPAPPLPRKGTQMPPPLKAPRTATPAEHAERKEPAAGRGQRRRAGERVEQHHQLQRAGAWEVRAMSAEAANRDLQAYLSKANEDRRAAETRSAELTKERDRFAARVKTPERDLGTARKVAEARAKPPA